MSNIKFIYQKKVHKVPLSVNNFQSLTETIRSVYKNLKQFYLFAIINPDFQDAVATIDSDVSFAQLKYLYQQNGWPTIKLLVTENNDYKPILKESWGLLNQSQVAIEKRQQDASTLTQLKQNDQSQQFAPQLGNQGIQAKVQQADNSQNTNSFDFRNNEQLKQIIQNAVDQRLSELGLLGQNKQQQNSGYTFILTSRIPVFIAQPNKKLSIQVTFQNNGQKTWRNAFVLNRDLNVSQILNNVAPGQYINFVIDLPYNNKHFENCQEYTYNFEIICENEAQEIVKIKEVIPIKVKAPQKDNNNFDQIFKQLFELFPQKGEGFLRNFILTRGQNKSYDEIVELILQEQF